MENKEICALLVELYADYQHNCGAHREYAEAVAAAITALSGYRMEDY